MQRTKFSIQAMELVTQSVEEGNVDTGVPHASKRVLREDNSDVPEAPANFPPMDNRIIPSEKKGI